MSQQFPPAQSPSPAPAGSDGSFGDPQNPWQTPPDGSGQPVWSGGQATPPPSRRGRTVAIVAASAVAVAALIGGGTWALGALGGGGEQPEQRVPSSAVAFAEVDLNPSLEQKLDALRFARKLPDVDQQDVREDSDLRQVVYEGLTEDVKGAPPWSQAKAWVGDRAAVAALPGSGQDPIQPVALFAVTDEAKARTDLGKIAGQGSAFAIRDGWAVLARTQALADQVAATTEDKSLAGAETFKQDVARLGDSGIVSAWFDGRQLASAAKSYAEKEAEKEAQKEAGATDGTLLPDALSGIEQFRDQLGHGAATLRFDGPQLELAVATVGTKIGPARAGTGLAQLPSDSLVAVSTQGLGKQFTDAWPGLAKQGGDALGEETGLKLPEDLAAVLGERTQLVLSKGETAGTPDFGIRVASKDLPGGYVLASSPKQVTALSADDGGLGGVKGFKDVLPDLDGAQTAIFFNLDGLADLGQASAEDAKGLKALGVAGLTAAVDGDGVSRLTLRVGTR